ncbi:TSK-associating protein 1 [Cardamine amara subsp. amara]|uniref:TSK-associating protein 1 n=1 Tax=Cardamine amara subsp. amara TaxID=228776 RepID=A0ABD1BV11_CARAN
MIVVSTGGVVTTVLTWTGGSTDVGEVGSGAQGVSVLPLPAASKDFKQIKVDDSINIEELSATRKIIGFSAKKQSSSTIPDVLGLGQSGSCGCSNLDEDSSIVISTKYSIEEVLSEESAIQGAETSSLSASLTQLVENHRKEKESTDMHRVLTSSSSSTSESAVTSETTASFEALSSAPISYISRLAKYGNVIKEELEASERVHIAQARAEMLKEAETEKQTIVDTHFTTAKTLTQRGDASVRKANDEQAAAEFAREATQSAEIIWVKFLSSL